MSMIQMAAVGDSTTFVGIGWYYQWLGIASTDPAIFSEAAAPRYSLRNHSAGRVAMNAALSGWRISDLETQAATLDAFINADYSPSAGRPVRHNILAVRIGTNQQEADPAAAAARIRTYCLARQAAGWLVMICPVWDSTQVVDWADDYSTPLNAIFATWGESDGVAKVVPATSSLLYAAGAAANLTYFSDGTHPTSAGHAIAAAEFATAYNELVVAL